MKLRPLNNVLIVKPDEIIKYQGLIVLPQKNTEEKISFLATVISFGDKCTYRFKKGQRVIIDRFRDKPFNLGVDNEKYRLITEDYVHGVIEDD